jgi:hypothetical protein
MDIWVIIVLGMLVVANITVTVLAVKEVYKIKKIKNILDFKKVYNTIENNEKNKRGL